MSQSTPFTLEIKGYIYALLDENGDMFYVGQTKWLPQRMTAHKTTTPRMTGYVILEKYTYDIALEYYEMAWINRLIEQGHELTNKNYVGVQVRFADDKTTTALIIGKMPIDPEMNWRNYQASLIGQG